MADPKEKLKEAKASFYSPNIRAMHRNLINLLEDKIETDALFDLTSHSDRRVNTKKAYVRLRSAYDEKKTDLEKSVGIKFNDLD